MKKRVTAVLAAAIFLIVGTQFCSCGPTYTCSRCGASTSNVYYDMSSSRESVMCEDCAREYWMPLDYQNYKVS